MSQNLQNLQNFAKFQSFQLDNLVDFEKMLQNAYFLAKIGADTAENEQYFAEILPKTGNYPRRRAAARGAAGQTCSARNAYAARFAGLPSEAWKTSSGRLGGFKDRLLYRDG